MDSQYGGLIFVNTIVLIAGQSLNEIEFPPRSGSNVASDNGGPIHIALAAPAQSFAAHFTYAVPLTVTLYDNVMSVVATATSVFNSNLAVSGSSGSSPNELIAIGFAGGFSAVMVSGAAAGGSFTIDDLTVSAVPEARPSVLIALGLLAVVGVARRRRVASPARVSGTCATGNL